MPTEVLLLITSLFGFGKTPEGTGIPFAAVVCVGSGDIWSGAGNAIVDEVS